MLFTERKCIHRFFGGHFPGANWMERESYDFFGVEFIGHPDMRRILNEDSMDYFPMRKEYALEDDTREDKDDRYFGRNNQ
ncbi:MAG: NADH-quinone oxidoreductase subunit C [Crocinitomicaceae bacterium]|nr:NADH-quinone oxidoreductase subunit C [Crocinitomicaceae bacterium]